MPELEAWEKVIITGNNGNLFLNSAHGPEFDNTGDANGTPHVLTCQHCHGGAADFTFNTMAEAHDGMFVDPSAPGQSGCTACHEESFARSACDQCHETAVTSTMTSLHTTQQGYITAINDRCGCDFDAAGSAGYQARCAGCHTTCGQCHISRPASVGGGFPRIASLYSHRFRATPHQTEHCTACHGSRVGHDYLGQGQGNVPDIHSQQGRTCDYCHTQEELHGDGTEYEHRYQVANMPRCEDCHAADVTVAEYDGSACDDCHTDVGTDPDLFVFSAADVNHAHHVATSSAACGDCHGVHGVPSGSLPSMQCQVCHSQPYKNCTNCHNLQESGAEAYDIDPSVLDLKIARNPSPYRTEYDVALVRHTPVDPGTFANWGLDLPNYDDKPTWQYTSPHNVIKTTPQTTVPAGESCAFSCHGTADAPSDYLLREADLYEADGTTQLPDYNANLGVVIPDEFPAGK